jgi:hypothetical protein
MRGTLKRLGCAALATVAMPAIAGLLLLAVSYPLVAMAGLCVTFGVWAYFYDGECD